MKKANVILILFLITLTVGVGIYLYFKKIPNKKSYLEKELNIFNWENYLSDEIINDFEKRFGIKVNLEVFDDSDYAFSVIQSQPDKYDLFVVEDDYVSIMKNLKLLAPLDHQKIPNLNNLKKEAKENPYDFQNQYCVPYVAGYTGILINTKYVKDFDGTRKIFWDEKYKGKIVMPNNSIEILINALFALGYDSERATKKDFERARQLALEQKNLVLGYYDPISQREAMIKEKAWISYHYTSDVLPVLKENPAIKFFAPKEGVLLWTDNWCIPKDAKHKEAAHLFLNYLLEPEISAKNSEAIGIPMLTKEMEKFLNPEFLSKTQGLDFPLEKEILSKSRYETYSIPKEEVQSIANQLFSELEANEE